MKKLSEIYRSAPVRVKLAAAFIGVVLLFAIGGRFIANDVPIYFSHPKWSGFPVMNKASFLAFKQDFANPQPEEQLSPVIPYAATTIDYSNTLTGPGNWKYGNRHLLGTDSYNRDVLAGIIYGSRTALLIGLLSNVLAVLIGIFLGSFSGYYRQDGFVASRTGVVLFLLVEILLLYLLLINPFSGVYLPGWYTRAILFLMLSGVFAWILLRPGQKNWSIPVDFFVMKSIEIFQSIPGMLLLLGISAVTGSMNMLKLTLLVALLRWPAITKLVRGEVMKVRQFSYIESARAIGAGDLRIMLRHILPNISRQIIIAFAFGVASSILLEASLSFLGLGLPPDQVTWGMLLSQARTNPGAWWLAVFPGMMISMLILSCYTIGNYLNASSHDGGSAGSII